ncbi:MAG TPA: prephenate dehydrogenase, partial [Gaiellaceae bacterium]|nr:prephenate dehydrogenase [Gaiellaceae bacterium]
MRPDRVLVIGAGLIGGSIGLGLRAAWEGTEIVASDRDLDAAERAVELGAAHRAGTIDEAVSCDLVVVATPVSSAAGVFGELARHVLPGAVVTDAGSTKRSVVEAALDALPEGVAFVGGHPMAGSEEAGVEHARGDLFEGGWWVLTPTRETPPEAYKLVLSMASALGARTIVLDPASHDALVATVSHLPQLLASGLMRFAGEQGRDRAALRALAAGGFRDMTRIASSRP